jgi:hypothetical protein
VIGPVGVQAAIVHRRIYDDAYERVFGAVPHYTTVVAGVSLGIGQPPPGFWF